MPAATRALTLGLQSLDGWSTQQKSPTGLLPPDRVQRLLPRDRERAQFDQQPLEAHATVSACIEAYQASDDPAWLQETRLAFEWFLGGNDLGLDLYDAKTGGCYDGLQEDRVNLNQGAESTLAFLLALGEMKLLESTPGHFSPSSGQLNASVVDFEPMLLLTPRSGVKFHGCERIDHRPRSSIEPRQ